MDTNPNARGLAAIAAALEPAEVTGSARVPVKSGPSAEEHQAALATAQAAGASAAVGSERTRIAAIINAPQAKGREGLANHLAFKTEMSAEAAIAMLEAAPVAAPEKTSRLDGKVPVPKVDAVESGTVDQAAGLGAALGRQLAKIGKKPHAPAH